MAFAQLSTEPVALKRGQFPTTAPTEALMPTPTASLRFTSKEDEEEEEEEDGAEKGKGFATGRECEPGEEHEAVHHHRGCLMKLYAMLVTAATRVRHLPTRWKVVWAGGIVLWAPIAFTVLLVVPGSMAMFIVAWTAFVLKKAGRPADADAYLEVADVDSDDDAKIPMVHYEDDDDDDDTDAEMGVGPSPAGLATATGTTRYTTQRRESTATYEDDVDNTDVDATLL
jgi:hypothetical protein